MGGNVTIELIQGASKTTEPQRLTVRHVSVYRYSEPVRFGEHRMMFRPRSGHDVRVVATHLVIRPAPSRLHWLHDVFDNSVGVATFSGEASELRFDSQVALEHYESPLPDYALERYAATWPLAYTNEEASDLVNARSRQYPDAEVDLWARRFLAPRGSTATMTLLRAMTQEIKSGFRYVRRTEKGVYRPADTLRHRSGSCRDFAVLMMDAVRSLGARRALRERLHLRARFRHDARWRRHARMAADLPAGCRLGGFRSDQQHHRQSPSDSRGGGLELLSGAAAVGHLAWGAAFVPWAAGGCIRDGRCMNS